MIKRLVIAVIFIPVLLLAFTLGVVDWIFTGTNHIFNWWEKELCP